MIENVKWHFLGKRNAVMVRRFGDHAFMLRQIKEANGDHYVLLEPSELEDFVAFVADAKQRMENA